jgi:hypothetical protein
LITVKLAEDVVEVPLAAVLATFALPASPCTLKIPRSIF